MIEPFRKLLGKQDAFDVRPEDPAGGVLGARPKLALRPRSAQEVAAVLQVAAERGVTVAPWGGGQHQDRGAVPASADIVLLTGQLAGITRFDAADQTLSAKAGTRLADMLGRHDHQVLRFGVVRLEPHEAPGHQRRVERAAGHFHRIGARFVVELS